MNRQTSTRTREQKSHETRSATERGRSPLSMGRHMLRQRREAAQWAEASFEIAAWMRQR